jgi:hypothetical protein
MHFRLMDKPSYAVMEYAGSGEPAGAGGHGSLHLVAAHRDRESFRLS